LVVYLIVVITAIGGFLALHPSPYTFLSNDQVTIQEINCMKWTHEHAGGRPINGILSIRNLAIISLGHSFGGEMRGNGQPLPDHFGYPAAPYIKDAVDQPTYIIITEHDRRTVLDLWSRADKFTLGDFTRLRSDPTAELIYQSDQCEVWRTID